MAMLEREKHQRSPGGDQMPIPTLIMASTGATSQQRMLLRTKFTHSAPTTTQKMFLASRENGIIITSNRRIESSCTAQHSYVDTGDESTLPTFMSVGASVSCQKDLERSTSFIVSQNGVDSPSLLTLDLLKTKSLMSEDVIRGRETKKQLHYKEKLRLLTDRIMAKSHGVDKKASNEAQETQEENESAPKNNVFDSIKNKLLACSMRICVDEAVVNHEGLVIDVHAKNFSYDDDTEVSSLTDATQQRFRSRYPLI